MHNFQEETASYLRIDGMKIVQNRGWGLLYWIESRRDEICDADNCLRG